MNWKLPDDEVSLFLFTSNPNSSNEMVVMKGRWPRRGRILSEIKISLKSTCLEIRLSSLKQSFLFQLNNNVYLQKESFFHNTEVSLQIYNKWCRLYCMS